MTKEEAAKRYAKEEAEFEKLIDLNIDRVEKDFIAGYDYADPIGALQSVNALLKERHHLNIELLLGKTLEQLYQIFKTEKDEK